MTNGGENVPEYIEFPQLRIKSSSTHAEMVAILSFLKKHKVKHTSKIIPKFPKKIYVFALNTNKTFRSSKPCEHCLKLLKYYGVKTVVYYMKNHIKVEKVSDIKDTIVSRGSRQLL
jgi:deoxycytidylate deaminase